ncbi:hypothetical protein ACET3Z_012596 [Daucus carota]
MMIVSQKGVGVTVPVRCSETMHVVLTIGLIINSLLSCPNGYSVQPFKIQERNRSSYLMASTSVLVAQKAYLLPRKDTEFSFLEKMLQRPAKRLIGSSATKLIANMPWDLKTELLISEDNINLSSRFYFATGAYEAGIATPTMSEATIAALEGITFLKVSPSSPEYSTGSTLLTHLTVDKPDCIAADASDAYHVIVQ